MHRCAPQLSRCWQPQAAFPGKAAAWLNRLAVKHQAAEVTRDTVLEEFCARSGLQVAFADTRTRQDQIAQSFSRQAVGAREAPGTEAA